MIRREEDRVWLDLDELYPSTDHQPNTVFKSMAIAFRAMGTPITYVDLMGLSAAAFRIQVGGALCPSSPHPHLGYPCDRLAEEILGFRFVEYGWEPKRRSKTRVARAAVRASIDGGAPVLTAEEETGLVVGYLADGQELLFRDPRSRKGDPPRLLGATPIWGLAVITEPPRQPSRDQVVRSLEVAVELARAQERFDGSYASGFTALRAWISHLRDASFIPNAELDLGAIIEGNAHIYDCFQDARRCASEYLSLWKSEFPAEVESRLDGVATRYADIAHRLDAGREHLPRASELRRGSEWTEEHRHLQASVLEEVLALETEVIEGIQEALKGME
jgi:hypothetical protein